MNKDTPSSIIRRAILTGRIVNYETANAFVNLEIADRKTNRHIVLACTIDNDEVTPLYAYLSASPDYELFSDDLFSKPELKAIGCDIALHILSNPNPAENLLAA